MTLSPACLACKPPPAKGLGNALRGDWPLKAFKKVKKELLEFNVVGKFKTWLKSDTDLEDKTVDEHVLGVLRLLHMLRVDGEPVVAEDAALDPRLLANLWTSGIIRDMMKLPMLSVKYSWTSKLWSAVDKFAEYHSDRLSDELMSPGDDGAAAVRDHQKKVFAAIRSRVGKGSNLQKKCKTQKTARRKRRMAEDDVKEANSVPRPEARMAVKRAMLELMALHEDCVANGRTSITESEQSYATSDVVGILYEEIFGGRSKEWSIMKAGMIQEMLRDGKDHVACPEHKTSYMYGDIAKWISPAVQKVFECYLALPRNEEPHKNVRPYTHESQHTHQKCRLRRLFDYIMRVSWGGLERVSVQALMNTYSLGSFFVWWSLINGVPNAAGRRALLAASEAVDPVCGYPQGVPHLQRPAHAHRVHAINCEPAAEKIPCGPCAEIPRSGRAHEAHVSHRRPYTQGRKDALRPSYCEGRCSFGESHRCRSQWRAGAVAYARRVRGMQKERLPCNAIH